MFRSLYSLFFPRTCAACGTVIDEDARDIVCDECLERLAWVWRPFDEDNVANKRLRYVLSPRPVPLGESFTPEGEPFAVSFVRFIHGGLTYNIVHSFKYHHCPEAAETAGRWMGRLMVDERRFIDDVDVIVPIPLHAKRERERGYNQAERLARGIAEVTGLPIVDDVLYRRANNRSQTQMKSTGRLDNAERMFNVRFPNSLDGKTVLLIDDVLTTGATITNAVRALRLIDGLNVKVATFAVAGGY